MKEYQSLLKDIKNKKTLPLYFLQGNEDYFIDSITDSLENSLLEEEHKAFNQHILYGLETDMPSIISVAKQFPFGSDLQLVLVKEAQHISFKKEEVRDILQQYAENPQTQTILVFAYKNNTLDGKLKLTKTLKSHNYLYTFEALRDYEINPWIVNLAQSYHLTIDEKSTFLMAEHLGTHLSAINNQMKKLQLILQDSQTITPEIIEEHIGISKDFNNFELTRAIGNKDATKAFKIVYHFEKNSKQNPIVVTVAFLYSFFVKIATMHVLQDKSDASISQAIKVSSYFKVLNEYKTAARNYSLKEATQALENLQEVDLKSKGVGAVDSDDYQYLKDFLYKTIYFKVQ